MLAKVQKWGNSLALRIPKGIAQTANIQENMVIEMTADETTIIIKSHKKRISLDELLEGMTPENRHEEVDFGPPQGREVW